MTGKFDENNVKPARRFRDAEEMGTKVKKVEKEDKVFILTNIKHENF